MFNVFTLEKKKWKPCKNMLFTQVMEMGSLDIIFNNMITRVLRDTYKT